MSDIYVARRDENSSDELQHYGVKGMKWGVRRDVELIANRQRNQSVRKAKDAYEMGKIDKSKYKSLKKQAKADQKAYMKKVKKDFESSSKAEQYKQSEAIKSKAIKDVPYRRLKKGIKAYNAICAASNIAGTGLGVLTAVAAGSAAAPAAAVALGVTAVGATAGYLGKKYVVDKVVDRLS